MVKRTEAPDYYWMSNKSAHGSDWVEMSRLMVICIVYDHCAVVEECKKDRRKKKTYLSVVVVFPALNLLQEFSGCPPAASATSVGALIPFVNARGHCGPGCWYLC